MGLDGSEPRIKWLSVSKVSQFLKCPLAARFRYSDHLPEPSVGTMLAGRAVHAVIEKALKQQLLNGKLMSYQDMDDLFPQIWEAQMYEESSKDSFSKWTWDEDDSEEKAKKESRELVRMSREEILPGIRPNLVEHKMSFELPSNAGTFKIFGVIDLLETGGILSDWKTTKKVSAFAKADTTQFYGYSVWINQETGDPITKARKIFLIRGKKPKWEIVNYDVTEPNRESFRYLAARVWESVVAGVFLPNTGGWWHSEKFCSFWNACPMGAPAEKGAVPVPAPVADGSADLW